MDKQMTKILFFLVAALGVVGLFVSGHLFDLMNVDIALDLTRLALAGLLFYAGYIATSRRATDDALTFFGTLYIGLAILGTINATLFGILPAGLTGFDIAFHAVSGIAALMVGVGARSSNNKKYTAAHS